MWFRGPTFDKNRVRWQFQNFTWLFENFGGLPRFKQHSLVIPTRNVFPLVPDGTHQFAEAVFFIVKCYMGMEDWKCRLKPLDDGVDLIAKLKQSTPFYGTSASTKGAAGLFKMSWSGEVTIFYSPELLRQPNNLVAVFAHELSHYLLATSITPNPGHIGDEEHLTDLTSIFRGFGIFSCNSAFNFEQWSDMHGSGWKSSNLGYLSESERAYAFAIYCKLAGILPKQVNKYLKANPRSIFKAAYRDLKDREDQLNEIREVEFVE